MGPSMYFGAKMKLAPKPAINEFPGNLPSKSPQFPQDRRFFCFNNEIRKLRHGNGRQ
jgi:hypothetical protein